VWQQFATIVLGLTKTGDLPAGGLVDKCRAADIEATTALEPTTDPVSPMQRAQAVQATVQRLFGTATCDSCLCKKLGHAAIAAMPVADCSVPDVVVRLLGHWAAPASSADSLLVFYAGRNGRVRQQDGYPDCGGTLQRFAGRGHYKRKPDLWCLYWLRRSAVHNGYRCTSRGGRM
jgi:hypothetical protein